MPRKKLTSHISSDYLDALSQLRADTPTTVYVEGYDDIAFWRSIFDEFEQQNSTRFEITTPARGDLAKGKKVVLSFADRAGKSLILCVDSDFDRLLGDATEQARTVNSNPYVVQTYVYSIENLLCLPSSLGSIASKITKNDERVFDFEDFFAQYSEIIYPAFVWYFFAAKIDRPHIFTLSEFRNTVKLNYLEIEDGGESTLRYISRSVERKVNALDKKYNHWSSEINRTKELLSQKGVKPEETHLYIQGHTFQDNIVKIAMTSVCNALRTIMVNKIENSRQEPLTRRNEMSSYNNSLRDIDTVVADNTMYRHSEHYQKIEDRIFSILGKKR